MAILSRDDLLARVRARIGEDTSDEAITLIEDVQDTFSDLETRASGETNWKQKYEQNDAEWRKKYTDRFFGNGGQEQEQEQEQEQDNQITFTDLFISKEE